MQNITDDQAIERAMRIVRFDPELSYIEAHSSVSDDEKPSASRRPDSYQAPMPAQAGPSQQRLPGPPPMRPAAGSQNAPVRGPRPTSRLVSERHPAAAAAPGVMPRVASPDSLHAVNCAPNGHQPRPIPMARRIPQKSRQPIEAPTLASRFSSAQALPEPAMLGHRVHTSVLQPVEPAPRVARVMGAVRAGFDALRPAEKRYQNDGKRAAAWLRDTGEVALDDNMRDVVLHPTHESSVRLQRLGFLEAHPNLHMGHAAEVQKVLARRYEQQANFLAGSAMQEESLTQALRGALPKAKR